MKYTAFAVSAAVSASMAFGGRHAGNPVYPTYDGRVMAGYQGWFHNRSGGVMFPDEESVRIDMWPDVSEYARTYPTGLKYANGEGARFFCSDDESTVETHFRWMEEYGFDGVFLQRFFVNATRRNAKEREESVTVVRHALKSAQRHSRAVSIMYDLSGLRPGRDDCMMLADDWKFLVDEIRVTSHGDRNMYLHHRGRPLVVIWGVGFPDRPYSIRDIKLAEFIDFLKNDPEYGGCSVMLGVPTNWRTLEGDCVKDGYLHEIVRRADIVMPWMVGRFSSLDPNVMNRYRDIVANDIAWCRETGVGYVPLVHPGFSWYNLSRKEKGLAPSPLAVIPRLGGRFYWDQIQTAVAAGAKSLYVAMFDEVNEGTAIFKVSDAPPVGKSVKFVGMDGCPSDHYLFLTGEAGRLLRGERGPEPSGKIPVRTAVKEPVDWVNTEIGTISHLLVPCFQTVQRPNAMLRFVPPHADYTVDRVGPLNLQTPAHRNPAVFRCHPYSGSGKDLFSRWSATWDNERSTPYMYEVVFDSCGVVFSIAPARQSAIVSFEFRKADEVRAVVLSGDEVEASGSGEVRVKDTFRGRNSSAPVWLSGEFDAKPVRIEREGDSVALVFDAPCVRFRYGVSYIGYDQAARNLSREIDGWNVGAVAAGGRAEWNEKLGKIEVEGGTDAQKSVFYSSLWRCYERMVNCTEDGRYRGWDGEVHETGGIDYYTDDWIWDSYRAHHPLMVLLEPEAESAKLASYIRMARQNRERWMPTFPVVSGDNHCMVNRHAAISFYDAWVKGVRGFDLKAAFDALDYTEKTESLVPWYRGALTGLDRFRFDHGYFPALDPGENETCEAVDTKWESRQAVSVTQGSSYDAWALSGIARELGDAKAAREYERMSKFYLNLWDPKTRFFRPKNSAGKFVEPFDPVLCGGKGARNYYTENNAWTYIWDVQHDIPGLRDLLGGCAGMSARLDDMLNTSCGNRFRYTAEMPDGSTGMMGMFTMANEPSFHIPYLYNFAGEPHKTQKFVRKTLEAWFRNDRMGMCGDEDGGGMSAYAVFSMMGFYPVTPGLPEYQLGSPVFTRVTMHLTNGKDFVVEAPGSSREAKYVVSAAIGGRPLAGTAIPHSAVVAGETLRLQMDASARRSPDAP